MSTIIATSCTSDTSPHQDISEDATTADIVVSMLEKAGVDHIFGVPGGAIENLNTALYKNGRIKPIVAKHEEGAAFMADGFARVSGRLGVCCSTAGPGATNLITGLATAYADSIPVCALTGQVSTSVFGKGAIQESSAEGGVNITSIFRQFTKYSGMIINEERCGHMMEKAVRMAFSGRSRPVHLSLPADIMKRPAKGCQPPFYRSEARIFDRESVKKAAHILLAAKRPAILAGWGVVLSRGAKELCILAEFLKIPVATSPKAKGVFPESHPLALGVLGFAGSPEAKEYLIEQDIDVLLAVGTSFNEMLTTGWDKRLMPGEHLIQIDVDIEEIGKNYPASIGLVGDARTVLTEITYALIREIGPKPLPKRSCYSKDGKILPENKKPQSLSSADFTTNSGLYHPQKLILDLQRSLPKDTIYFADIGTSMAWAIRYLVMDNPYSFYVSLGFGAMGYAVAAPIGAKLAFSDRPIVTLVGDGSFLMNGFEVATAVNYQVPVVWVIFNNAMLGMVYHGRRLFKAPIPEGIPSQYQRVDFAKVAEGLGARGITIKRPDEITPALIEDIFLEGRPTVLDVWIDSEVVPPIHGRIESVDKHF